MNFKSLLQWLHHKHSLIQDSLSYLAGVPEVSNSCSTILQYAFTQLQEILSKLKQLPNYFINENPQQDSRLIHQKQIDSLKSELKRALADRDQLQNFYEQQFKHIQEVQTQLSNIRNQYDIGRSQISQVYVDKQRLKSALQQARFQIQELKAALGNRDELIQISRSKLSSLDKRHSLLQDQLKESKASSSLQIMQLTEILTKSKKQYQQALQQAEKDNKQLMFIIKKTNSKIATLIEAATCKQAQNIQLIGHKQQLCQNLQVCNTQIKSLTKQLSQQFERRARVEDISCQNKKYSQQLQSQVQKLKQSQCQLKKQTETVSLLLQEQQNKNQFLVQENMRIIQAYEILQADKEICLNQLLQIREHLEKGQTNLDILQSQLQDLKYKSRMNEQILSTNLASNQEKYQSDLKQLIEMLNQAAGRIKTLQSQLFSSRKQKFQQQQACSSSQYRLEEMKLQLVNIEEQNRAKDQLLRKTNKALEDCRNQLFQCKSSRDSLMQRIYQAQSKSKQLSESQLQILSLQEERRRLLQSLQCKSKEISKTRQQVQYWKEQTKRQSGLVSQQKRKGQIHLKELTEKLKLQNQTLKMQLKKARNQLKQKQQSHREELQRNALRMQDFQSILLRKANLDQLMARQI